MRTFLGTAVHDSSFAFAVRERRPSLLGRRPDSLGTIRFEFRRRLTAMSSFRCVPVVRRRTP